MSLWPATFVLLIIIFTGVLSDMIGVAATVAKEEPFNAKASKKIFGAKYGLYLAQHGERVASLMCDIVGDICGTVGGAIGAIIVLRIVNNFGNPQTFINLIVIGIISALTVGGKAFFKHYGIKKSNEIIFFAGKLLATFGYIKSLLLDKIRGEKING
jgi:CDP-diglyceride synthetase